MYMQDKYHDTITEADCATLHCDVPDKERYLLGIPMKKNKSIKYI